MKTLIGGSVATVIGLICLGVWIDDFLDLIAGAVPILLVIGGGLAVYLGFDELKDTWKKDDNTAVEAADDSAKYKTEIDDLKKEIETLKSDKV